MMNSKRTYRSRQCCGKDEKHAHELIMYRCSKCPFCTAIDEHKKTVDDLESKIKNLEEECGYLDYKSDLVEE